MNKSFNRDTIEKHYRNHLKTSHKSSVSMYDMELILTCAYTLRPRPQLKEVWTILTGYYCYEISSTWKKRAIEGVFYRYHEKLHTEKGWEEHLSIYQTLPLSKRLFAIGSNGEWYIHRPTNDPYIDLFINEGKEKKVLQLLNEETKSGKLYSKDSYVKKHNRIKIPRNKGEEVSLTVPRLFLYYHLLKFLPKNKVIIPVVVSDGLYRYQSPIHSEEMRTFQAQEVDGIISPLWVWRDKKRILRQVNEQEREQYAKEMGNLAGSTKWEQQAKRSLLTNGKRKGKHFGYYSGYIHITGGVGVGKNSFIEEELYRLYQIEKQDIVTVVVLSNNSKCLELHETLTLLGLEAVVIPGVHGKDKHEKEYWHQALKVSASLSQLAKKTDTLSTIDGDCLFRILHDVNSGKVLPCMQRKAFSKYVEYEDGTSQWEETCCPYTTQCSRMKSYMEMKEKKIWITNHAALEKTRLPQLLDPLKRPLWQLAYDVADIVFLDEIDDTMNAFGSSCMEQTKITGDHFTLLSRILDKTTEMIRQNQSVLKDEHIESWNYYCNEIRHPLHKLEGFLQEQLDFANDLNRKAFSIYSLAIDFLSYFQFQDDLEEMMYKNTLMEYLVRGKNEWYREKQAIAFIEKFFETTGAVLRMIDRKKRREIIDSFICFFGKVKPINTKRQKRNYPSLSAEERVKLHFEFFTYIYYFEKNLKKLVSIFPSLPSKFFEDEKLSTLFGNFNLLHRLLAKPSIGTKFGYRILAKRLRSGQVEYSMELLRYFGNTKKLLTDVQILMEKRFLLYDQATMEYQKNDGPCVVGLSGTSFLPGSPHFHVPMKPIWQLKNRGSKPRVEMFYGFKPEFQEQYDYLYVSGSSEEQRNEMLKKMTHYYVDSGIIESELHYWKEKHALKEARKVLIVVNSYRDCEAVANALLESKHFQNTFAYLTNLSEELLDKKHVPLHGHARHRQEVEFLPHEDIDVLIAPLFVIARGFNILQQTEGKKHRSYFGSAFVFVRPYYSVDDMQNIFTLLHHKEEEQLLQIQDINDKKELSNKKLYGSYMKMLYKEMNATFAYLQTKPFMTNRLTEQEMEQLSKYTLVLMQQVLGRMVRGDTDCRFIFADSKLDSHREEQKGNKRYSMIANWTDILKQYESHRIVADLFFPFAVGLRYISEYEI